MDSDTWTGGVVPLHSSERVISYGVFYAYTAGAIPADCLQIKILEIRMIEYTKKQELLVIKIVDDLWESLIKQISDNSEKLEINEYIGMNMTLDCLSNFNTSVLVGVIKQLGAEKDKESIMQDLFNSVIEQVNKNLPNANRLYEKMNDSH